MVFLTPVLCSGRGSSPHITVRVLGGGCAPPTLHLVMQVPPAPRVAEAEPESQHKVAVEQRLRYHEKVGPCT